MKLPKGELYMNEASNKNCIAFIDSMNKTEIVEFFQMYSKAEKLIHKKNGQEKTYLRKDYLK